MRLPNAFLYFLLKIFIISLCPLIFMKQRSTYAIHSKYLRYQPISCFYPQIEVGLEMVDRLIEKGEQLAKLNPKKAARIRQTIQEMQTASMQLRETCTERTTRLEQASELVKFGQLMDEAVETVKETEAQLMSDDYNMGENGLKRLLEKQEVSTTSRK